MPLLSSSIGAIKPHYDVVVVGSGYGGGIAASRLARAKKRVCVLERGKELLAGDFPDTYAKFSQETQISLPAEALGPEHYGPRTGLYDVRLDEKMNVVVGCGLGGTSLINAGITVRPDARLFDDPRWPVALRNDPALLEEGFRRAEEMLRPEVYPDHLPKPAKLIAIEAAGRAIGEKVSRVPLSIAFESGLSPVGLKEAACRLCGDCVSGCNHSSKRTVATTYLPDAKNHGAEIFTEVSVRRVERRNTHWVVHYELFGAGREAFDSPELFVIADMVILAAGVLGTPEILLRSRAAGLSMSSQVGAHMSANRNVLGVGFNADVTINGIGFGNLPPEGRPPVGPLITAGVDLRDRSPLDEGVVVEEGAVPGPFAHGFVRAMLLAAAAFGSRNHESLTDIVEEMERNLESICEGPYRGATNNTLVLLGIGHDDSPGRLYLDNDRIRVAWPEGREERVAEMNKILERIVRPLGATFVQNPLWSDLTRHSIVTVQPLGGCVMADDASSGAVNHLGQLFAESSGSKVHETLVVLDGSIVPRSTGINPLLTISALAERACMGLAKKLGVEIDYAFTAPSALHFTPRTPGIRFTEVMRGHVSKSIKDDCAKGEEAGKNEESPLTLHLTVIAEDLEHLLADPLHRARVVGTAAAPALSPEPMQVTDGTLSILAIDPADPKAKRLVYGMRLTTRDGAALHLEGIKYIRDDFGFDIWSDATTLFVTLYEGALGGAVAGKGVVRVGAVDFARQLRSMTVTHVEKTEDRARILLRFSEFFGLTLLETYLPFRGGLGSLVPG